MKKIIYATTVFSVCTIVLLGGVSVVAARVQAPGLAQVGGIFDWFQSLVDVVANPFQTNNAGQNCDGSQSGLCPNGYECKPIAQTNSIPPTVFYDCVQSSGKNLFPIDNFSKQEYQDIMYSPGYDPFYGDGDIYPVDWLPPPNGGGGGTGGGGSGTGGSCLTCGQGTVQSGNECVLQGNGGGGNGGGGGDGRDICGPDYGTCLGNKVCRPVCRGALIPPIIYSCQDLNFHCGLIP